MPEKRLMMTALPGIAMTDGRDGPPRFRGVAGWRWPWTVVSTCLQPIAWNFWRRNPVI